MTHKKKQEVSPKNEDNFRFASFARELFSNLKLWLFCIGTMQVFRLAFIAAFHSQIAADTSWGTIVKTAVHGLRYDAMIAGYVIIIPVLLTVIGLFTRSYKAANRGMRYLGFIYLLLFTALAVITIGYFAEYNDQFNHFLFGFFYDDTRAIIRTIWSTYHPILGFTVMGIIAFSLHLLLKRWLNHQRFFSIPYLQGIFNSTLRKTVFVVFLCCAFVVSLRGSTGSRPAQKKDAAVTGDEFLDKTVMNPFTTLRYAVKEHLELKSDDGPDLFLDGHDMAWALQQINPQATDGASIDQALLKTAPGPAGSAPDHVFLIIMESFEAWPMFPEYASLNLTPELISLGKKGLSLRPFVAAAGGTMESAAAIITGLPDAGVQTNYRINSRTPYPSSVAEAFKKMGYRTRVFYGGFPSWQRFGDFSREQGFEEIYGGGHVSGASTNEWGVDDDQLFTFITKTVDPAIKSFNLILTTTFHPPYDVDVRAHGFALEQLPDELKKTSEKDPDMNLLGHLWYSDHSLGNFVRDSEKKLDRPVFAVTGDHAGRRTISRQPSLAERRLVPFVLYGPEVLEKYHFPATAAGSHIDISPTLIELCAPREMTYYALGQSLFNPSIPQIGLGKNVVVTAAGIVAKNQAEILQEFPGGIPMPAGPRPAIKSMWDRDNAAHAIAWWRIMRGSDLDGKTEN